MSPADDLNPAGQATSMLIQAAVKSGEARAILLETQRVLANADAELSNTARLVEHTKALALQAGFMQGVRVGRLSGVICGLISGAVIGGCAAMFLRAAFSS